MEGAGLKGVKNAFGTEEDLFVGGIVEEAGQDDFGGACGFGWGGRDLRALQCVGTFGVAVPDRQFVAGGHQTPRHGRAHFAQSQESNVHCTTPSCHNGKSRLLAAFSCIHRFGDLQAAVIPKLTSASLAKWRRMVNLCFSTTPNLHADAD